MAGKTTILIIDDDESFGESNKDLLEAYGYEAHAASDGTAGIALARKLKPDVIILDVMMTTDTEGFETARKIREIPGLADTRVLLVTGFSKAFHLPADLQADPAWLPVHRILEKPIEPQRLLAEIKRALKKE